MYKKLFTILVSILVLTLVLNASGAKIVNQSIPLNNYGDILYVGGDGPGNYTSIQEAIDNATNGDTVFVYPGTYDEHLLVDKSINLIGQNAKNTIIDAHGYDAVLITADSVKIEEFTITNAATGIVIYYTAESKILKNIIKSNDHHGIYGSYSYAVLISENTISNNLMDGIFFMGTFQSTIAKNTISNNGQSGLYLKASSFFNEIFENMISQNKDGIKLSSECSKNRFYENTIKDNTGKGVNVFDISSYNHFYHNNFLRNNQNAYDPADNFWDNGNEEGNYWDDYKGVDLFPRDGIGDMPYDIPGGDNKDWYPLMKPYKYVRNFPLYNHYILKNLARLIENLLYFFE